MNPILIGARSLEVPSDSNSRGYKNDLFRKKGLSNDPRQTTNNFQANPKNKSSFPGSETRLDDMDEPPSLSQYQIDPSSEDLEKWNAIKNSYSTMQAQKNSFNSSPTLLHREGSFGNDGLGNLWESIDSYRNLGQYSNPSHYNHGGRPTDIDWNNKAFDEAKHRGNHKSHSKYVNSHEEIEGDQDDYEERIPTERRKAEMLESLKTMEENQLLMQLKEQLISGQKEQKELKATIKNMNKIKGIMIMKNSEREEQLLEEIKTLKEYNAKYSEDRFSRMENHIQRLRDELTAEKRHRAEMEEQYREEHQELMALYQDAEETKKHVVEQLGEIKQLKEAAEKEKKALDQERLQFEKSREEFQAALEKGDDGMFGQNLVNFSNPEILNLLTNYNISAQIEELRDAEREATDTKDEININPFASVTTNQQPSRNVTAESPQNRFYFLSNQFKVSPEEKPEYYQDKSKEQVFEERSGDGGDSNLRKSSLSFANTVNPVSRDEYTKSESLNAFGSLNISAAPKFHNTSIAESKSENSFEAEISSKLKSLNSENYSFSSQPKDNGQGSSLSRLRGIMQNVQMSTS